MDDIIRHQSDSRLSRVVVHNGVVYVAGLTADNRDASMQVQTEEILGKIDALLKVAGTSKSRLLTATIYVADMGQKAAMDSAWIAWVDPHNAPTRATVRAELGTSSTLVEIVVSAAL